MGNLKLKSDSLIMSPAQLQTELLRCEYCEEKPCKEACPVNCSPFDFIMAARTDRLYAGAAGP